MPCDTPSLVVAPTPSSGLRSVTAGSFSVHMHKVSLEQPCVAVSWVQTPGPAFLQHSQQDQGETRDAPTEYIASVWYLTPVPVAPFPQGFLSFTFSVSVDVTCRFWTSALTLSLVVLSVWSLGVSRREAASASRTCPFPCQGKHVIAVCRLHSFAPPLLPLTLVCIALHTTLLRFCTAWFSCCGILILCILGPCRTLLPCYLTSLENILPSN